MNRKRYTIKDYTEKLQDKIELLEGQFGGVHPIYKEMGRLVRSLRVKIIDLKYTKKGTKKHVSCNCDACFSCEYQDSGVRIERGNNGNY